MQGVLFQAAPASELTTVRSAYRLGKWKQGQLKPRAVLVELMSVGARHTAFQASSRLRAARIRLDEDLTPLHMSQRKVLSTDFQCLKAKGYKVDGTLGPLTATEARAFNDVVGEFGASDGGF